MEKPKRARRRKPDTAKVDLKPVLAVPGGQGVHREVESESTSRNRSSSNVSKGGITRTRTSLAT